MDLKRGFRIGQWEIFPLSGDIQSGREVIHLEPKVMEVLVALAEQAEQVVLREELLEKVWGARAAISDEPLTRCIAQLRQSLGDSSRNPKYIQTVPKRGYRMLQAVQGAAIASDGAAQPRGGSVTATADSDASSPGYAFGARAGMRRWTTLGWIGGLAVVSLTAYVLGTKGLPLGEPGPWSEQCSIEPPDRIVSDRAHQLCEDGLERMAERTAQSLSVAMEYFRFAIEEQEDYGSAIVNSAKSMVLLPTYDESAVAEDCEMDGVVSDHENCFEVAIALLEESIGKFGYIADYIADYIYGIRGYVYTKQHRWNAAKGQFSRALVSARDDADMLQWYSQFLSATGDYQGAREAVEMAIEIDPNSPVNYDRLGVVLMWLGDTSGAKVQYERAAEFPGHSPYAASELVLNIRLGEWDKVRTLLRNYAVRERGRSDAWVDPFVAWLETGDESRRSEAVSAVQAAVDSRDLYGQYRYGAWVYLEEPERAIRSAILLIRSNPTELDVEFLYTEETRVLRNNAMFEDLILELGLDEYWAAEDGLCPEVFSRDGEINWCERLGG